MAQIIHAAFQVAHRCLDALAAACVQRLCNGSVNAWVPETQFLLASGAHEDTTQSLARALAFAVAGTKLLLAICRGVTTLLGNIAGTEVAPSIGVGLRQKVAGTFARCHGCHVLVTHGGGKVTATLRGWPGHHVLDLIAPDFLAIAVPIDVGFDDLFHVLSTQTKEFLPTGPSIPSSTHCSTSLWLITLAIAPGKSAALSGFANRFSG